MRGFSVCVGFMLIGEAWAAPVATPAPAVTREALSAQLAESQKKADSLKSQLDSLDRQRTQVERASREAQNNDPNAAVEIARSDLAALQSQRSAVAKQERLDEIEQKSRIEGRRMMAEIQAAQLKDQLDREQGLLWELNRKRLEARSINIDTDALRSAERAVVLQGQRVNDLQSVYLNLQRTLHERETSELASQAEQDPSRLAALDNDIQRQQELLAQLEKTRDESARRQQAGMSSVESLNERYMELKRDYDEQTSLVDEQRKSLARIKE